MLEICKWYQNAVSPVIFMIDDFCNVWIDLNHNGKIDPGEDWGYAQRNSGSSLYFLEQNILDKFTEVKVTFFTPVGVRSPVIEKALFPFVSKQINCDEETKKFFRSVGENRKFEIAYHGTTHGRPGKIAADFIQEWDSFVDLKQATDTIRTGINIYKDVFGKNPVGGKYCGYVANEFSDDSIDQNGFLWWCRYCNVDLIENDNNPIEGDDQYLLSNYDIKYFGKNKVVDIPTTINGSLCHIAYSNSFNVKNIGKKMLKPLIQSRKLEQLRYLLDNSLVISIQEHIAPSRADGKRQMPNIFDDLDSLQMIFQLLKGYPVWYCTCSELANYVRARDNVDIIFDTQNSFTLETNITGLEKTQLTLKMNSNNFKVIKQPDYSDVLIKNGLANIDVIKGKFFLY
ncbi:hypothetical protein [Dehalobacter sp. TBBPA1]|uniref:hypothetical protein n=1 Tax=Dehalobacter sp. TBBPA1 TaxID=3235037 RepID=UPI0034A272F5